MTLVPFPSWISSAPKRYARCLLLSPLFYAGLAACAEAPRESAPEPSTRVEASVEVQTDALGGYAPTSAVTGDLVAFSQIFAPVSETGVVIGDVESQTGAALRVLDEALAEVGLTRADIAHLTVHIVVDESGAIDAQGVARAWRRNFANALQPAAPARTLVGVAALPVEGARISLTALANRPAPNPETP